MESLYTEMTDSEKFAANLSKWQVIGNKCAVELVAGEKRVPGELYIRELSAKQQKVAALRAFAGCLAAAVVGLLIPVLHFLLVPLALLASILMPIYVYYRKSYVLGGAGVCPHCAAQFEIMRAPLNWPLHDICAACNQHATINLVK